jgi:uncharacterized protein YndB with AHSA1/START domain
MNGERNGTITELPDGRPRLEFRRSWPDPIEDVWSALTEPDRMARWLGVYEGDRGAGGRGTFTMTQEEQAVGEPMTILECDPPRRLVVEWQSEMEWRVELDLAVEGAETVLRFSQAFAAGTQLGDVATGWHWYLDKLDAEIGGGAPPAGWDDFLAEVGPGYGP